MGLISRVSSRTYRKLVTKKQQTWVLDEIHGTNDERPVVENHRCTRSESWNSVTSVGPAKEFLEPPESLMLSTTPLPTNWSELKLWSKVLSLPSMLPHSDNSTSPTTPKPSAERRPTNSLKKKPKPSTTSTTAAQKPKRSMPTDKKPLMLPLNSTANQVNADELMVTSWKVKNSTSTSRK